MDTAALLEQLAEMGSEANRKGMARFGINTEKAWGIAVPKLRSLAKTIGKDPELSEALWQTGFHEARLLSFFLLPAAACTPQFMEARLPQINSWDLCDQACAVFATHPDALKMVMPWSQKSAEFEKRASFSLMAFAAVHQKKTADEAFLPLLSIIEQHTTDPRRYVYKAVNWALRQIGKRSLILNEAAIQTALRIRELPDKTARWIASDALRE
jgi:3-methyladenine DNA glycosylase AlkD